ncbi:hypothetical protein L6452_28795 [Arctium lappa]|uniref:Uncharacterized protein n=1 Tax=Arctium lappa TaxID=4217 RepID=A0ACB8ZZ80_ARCLA|nr:hypothetical protein L6452_28795 [Arctium lappa]
MYVCMIMVFHSLCVFGFFVLNAMLLSFISMILKCQFQGVVWIRRRNSKFVFLTVCKIKGKMVLCFLSTPQKLRMTMGLFLGGSSLFGVGLYLSYVHVARQQAWIQD